MRLRQHAELESEIPKFVWRNEKMPIDETNKGRRVELVSCDDPYTRLKPGDQGTYEFANITGEGRDRMVQHNIKWDSASTLMLIEGHDSFKFVASGKSNGKQTVRIRDGKSSEGSPRRSEPSRD
jgi:hypothetical protein